MDPAWLAKCAPYFIHLGIMATLLAFGVFLLAVTRKDHKARLEEIDRLERDIDEGLRRLAARRRQDPERQLHDSHRV